MELQGREDVLVPQQLSGDDIHRHPRLGAACHRGARRGRQRDALAAGARSVARQQQRRGFGVRRRGERVARRRRRPRSSVARAPLPVSRLIRAPLSLILRVAEIKRVDRRHLLCTIKISSSLKAS